jgi:hypothetical protein
MAEGFSVKPLRLVCLLALAAPQAAHAAGTSILSRDLTVRAGAASSVVRVADSFDLVGLHWQGSGQVLFRTQHVSGGRSGWQRADADSGPDDQVSKSRRASGWHLGNAAWVGHSDRIEWRTTGRVRRVRAYFIRSPVERVPVRTVSVAGSPTIVSRAGWNADERIRRAAPRYASALRLAVVHHTAGSNAYSPAQSAAIVRGIELYHVKANGWDDIGYNFLVDRYGQVFEGRYGGITRNVIGAHAEGFNTGSVGIAVIGNFASASLPKVAEQALAKLIAWRLDVAHVEPVSSLSWVSYGNPRFRVGASVALRAVSGHRDTGFTACPGRGIYSRLGAIAAEAEGIGLPKLYAPVAVGKIGGIVRFSARLSAALPWTIRIVHEGQTVAQASGLGPRIAWTWNSAGKARGRYIWTMEAGSSVRPASGLVGGPQTTPPTPPGAAPVHDVFVSPSTISPNGDGYGDVGTIRYVLAVQASVSVRILDVTGATVAALIADEPQSPGRNALAYNPEALPDGQYTVVVTARTADGRLGSARKTFLVNRVLSSVSAQPPVFTPDGDGIEDVLSVGFAISRPALVTVEIQQAGGLVAMIFEETLAAGAYGVSWDGRTPTGPAAPGSYEVVVRAADELGESQQSAPFELAAGG